MIILLTATGKGHTWRNIVKWDGMPALKRWSYWHVFHRRKVPHATYIFTDFDRLAPWELEPASRLYRLLKASGAKVLNDPAKFKNRYALLKALKNHGVNDFDVWSAGLEEVPDRFPVFCGPRPLIAVRLETCCIPPHRQDMLLSRRSNRGM